MPDYLSSFKERSETSKVEEKNINRRLLELSALFEISQTLNSSLNLRAILDNILLVPMGRMMIGKGLVLLKKNNYLYKIETLKGLPFNLINKEIELHDLPAHPLFISENDSEFGWIDFFTDFKIEILLPFVSKSDILGVIGFSAKLTGEQFNEEEIEFLTSLSNIAATSIENALIVEELKNVNYELDHRIQELNTLFDIGKEFNLTFEREKILKTLSYAIMGQITVNNFVIALKEDNTFKIGFVKGNIFKVFEGQNCAELCKSCTEITSPYLRENESELDHHLAETGIEVVIPMRLGNENKGFIFLGEKITKQKFNSGDFEFLQTLGNIAIIALENARLFEETLEKQRLEEEMALARNIQNRLLPKDMPHFKNLDIQGINIPSKHVGGDYFDIIRIDEKRIALTIADVSGKGMPAALLMSNLQASLHSLITENYQLDDIVQKVNNVIHRNTNPEKYITFFIGILDTKNLEFIYVNAGHNPPYLKRPGKKIQELHIGGLIIGMMSDIQYETGTVKLQPQDLLFMYTDGVTEAMTENEEEFEEKRVIEFMEKCPTDMKTADFNSQLLQELKVFTGSAPQIDDITILTLRVLK